MASPVFKTAWSRLVGTEGSTPFLLRHFSKISNFGGTLFAVDDLQIGRVLPMSLTDLVARPLALELTEQGGAVVFLAAVLLGRDSSGRPRESA